MPFAERVENLKRLVEARIFVCPKLELASCVYWSFYDVHIDHVLRKFVRYALRDQSDCSSQ
jgi:hypothetical protein